MPRRVPRGQDLHYRGDLFFNVAVLVSHISCALKFLQIKAYHKPRRFEEAAYW